MSRARDLADSADLNFDDGTLVIDSGNNRVGIGTSSPSGKLHVSSTDIDLYLTGTRGTDNTYAIKSAGANAENIQIRDETASQRLTLHGTDIHAWYIGGNEKSRIDSSGNLIVGNTTFDSANVGAGIGADGGGYFTRDGNRPLIARRKTSDGEIAAFYKDGTQVGSIGSSVNSLSITSAGSPFIAGTGSQSVGLRINSSSNVPSIIPVNNTNAVQDNAINLGYASGRFKDLYLSGGVYVGGTGSANKLDDYEEGTFTPAFQNVAAPSYTLQVGYYTKIGRLVHFTLRFEYSGLDTTDTSRASINLPFTASESGCSVTLTGDANDGIQITNEGAVCFKVTDGNAEISFNANDGVNYWDYSARWNTSGRIEISGTYTA